MKVLLLNLLFLVIGFSVNTIAECPRFNFPDSLMFGKSYDDVMEVFPDTCDFSIYGRFYSIPNVLWATDEVKKDYAEGIYYLFGEPRLYSKCTKAQTVKCECWEGIELLRLWFVEIDSEFVLFMLEKRLDVGNELKPVFDGAVEAISEKSDVLPTTSAVRFSYKNSGAMGSELTDAYQAKWEGNKLNAYLVVTRPFIWGLETIFTVVDRRLWSEYVSIADRIVEEQKAAEEEKASNSNAY